MDLYNERMENFHLIPVTLFDHNFLVGSVHHEWILQKEQGPLEVAHHAMNGKHGSCSAVDVGMNDGFYTQMSAAYGCKVWSFELQESCIKLSRNATELNKFKHLINIIRAPVSSTNAEPFNIPHGNEDEQTRCDGGFSIAGANPENKAHKAFAVKGFHTLYTVSLDAFFSHNVVLDFLKVDVEGHDPEVLAGAENLFKTHRILRATIEVAANLWGQSFQDGIKIYERIYSYGYIAKCVTEVYGNVNWVILEPVTKFKDFHDAVMTYKQCEDWEFYIKS